MNAGTPPMKQLSFRWQRFNQIAWALFTLLALGFFFWEVSTAYRELLNPPPEMRANLAQLGLGVQAHAFYLTGLRSVFMLVHLIIAGMIILRRPNERITIFVALTLVLMGVTFWPPSNRIVANIDTWHLSRSIAQFLSTNALITLFFVFPDGRFVPRWSVLFVVAVFPLVVAEYFFPASPLNPQNWHVAFSTALSLFTLVIMIYAPVYRYRSVSNRITRQQTKWVVYGISIALIGFFITAFPSDFNYPQVQLGTLFGLLQITGLILFFLCIPISIGIAILRFRLWNIDPIINRTLVYGALSFLTIAFYVLIVGAFAVYFQNNESDLIVSLIAAGVIAILFEPLRRQLQRGVNRLMYGERDDPATVLTHLSQHLESAIAPDSVLQTIVETLAQTLKLPYAAIALTDESPCCTSTDNPPPPEVTHLPLVYQTERVGELILAPRSPGESFSPADMKLITIIAQQAGIAAYTVHLHNDLQRSRERLVTAQEEERRRLRRDLHDGVGPTLASLIQRIDTAAEYVDSNPEKSKQLLKDLKGQVRETIAEIRRLVYALRPPVLDEFGLASAIREYVAQYTGPNGLQITFDLTEPLPPLPAAVEVAVYRIALEAFTNIVNHAQASACHIQLKVESGALLLEVSDNGQGIRDDIRMGVGLTSMRERASELGGECTVENLAGGGTRISARLPVAISSAQTQRQKKENA